MEGVLDEVVHLVYNIYIMMNMKNLNLNTTMMVAVAMAVGQTFCLGYLLSKLS